MAVSVEAGPQCEQLLVIIACEIINKRWGISPLIPCFPTLPLSCAGKPTAVRRAQGWEGVGEGGGVLRVKDSVH